MMINERKAAVDCMLQRLFPLDGQAFHSAPRTLHNGLKIAISSSTTRTPGTDVVVAKSKAQLQYKQVYADVVVHTPHDQGNIPIGAPHEANLRLNG